MKVIMIITAVLFVAMLNIGCNDGERFMLININKTKAEEVRGLIAIELKVGASSHDIEEFFKRHKIGYSYDRFAHRYQGIIRSVDDSRIVDQAVLIYIYVDEEKVFVSSEVRDSFTAL